MPKAYSCIIHVIVLFSCTFSALTRASTPTAPPNLYLDGNVAEINLTFYSERYLDPTNDVSFADIRTEAIPFEPILETKQLHLGYYAGTLWLRNVITNTTDQPLRKILSFEYANLDNVRFYVVDEAGELTQRDISGTHIPASQRSVTNRHASFPVNIPPNSTRTFYSQINSNGSLTAFHRLQSPYQYEQTYSNELFWLSLYCGMLAALGLYNLLLFGALKQSVFLRYSLFVISFLVGTLTMNGLGPQLFWDHHTLDTNRLLAFSFSAAAFTATLFVRQFLDLKQHSNGWYRITIIPLALSIVSMLSAVFISAQTALKASDVNGLVTGIVLLSCGISCYARNVPGAKLFVIAWTLLLCGALVHALRNLGVVPTHFLSLYGMQIGSALEMLLLSFAIAAKFNQLKHEKQRAQDEALTALQTQEAKLEQKVAQRTYELEQMAHHDSLTGLLNRNGLNQALRLSMSRRTRNGSDLTLFMLDLDRFKPINDKYGHDVGDRALKVVAERLLASISGCDAVARFGGDEFIIISERFSSPEAIQKFILSVKEQVRQPMRVGVAEPLFVSVSVGFHQASAETTVNELLKEADKAMYQVKYHQHSHRTPR